MTDSSQMPVVSVVIPVRNEEKYIARCLESLIRQTYPTDRLECIIADGLSSDASSAIIAKYAAKYPFIKTVKNEKITVQHAVNIAVNAAHGEYIVRFDAHTEFADNYIEQCIAALQKTGAANVGGPTVVSGTTPKGRAIAAAYYSRFALGGGTQHIEGYEGESDTVSYGAFRRSDFIGMGGLDERLECNEDDDFNFRIKESGGHIYITDKIKSCYHPRDDYRSLFVQYFRYGFWKTAVIKKHRKPARLSHLVPAAFVLFILFGAVISAVLRPALYVYLAVWALYIVLDFATAFTCPHADGIPCKLRVAYVQFVLHIAYGVGFIGGIFRFAGARF